MSRLLLKLSLCLLIAANAFAGFSKQQELRPATPEELALKDVSFAPGAAAVILDWVEVDEDTQSVATEYYRVKILTEEGRKYADVEVPYLAGYPFGGRVTDIAARTIQPDGRIVPFNGKVYDKVLLKAGGVRVRAKTFSLPDVQPGSILEYRYQRRWAAEMLLNTSWIIQRDIPVMHAHMTLRPYEGSYNTYFTYYNLPTGKTPQEVKGRGRGYELELTDVPPFPDEQYAPPADALKMRVNFFYTMGRVESAEFWKQQSSGWNKSVESFLGKPKALAAVVQPLTGKNELETLQNIYAKVQTFKNLSFEDEVDADGKKNAGQVVEKSEGYRSEINRAFVALARAAGIDATVVLVATRDRHFFTPTITDAEQVDAEIAVVNLDGKTVYLDPGTPTAPFGVISWEKSNTAGIRAAKGATAEFKNVAEQAPDQAVTRRSADLRLNGDVLEGTITATFTGQEALSRRLRTWGDDDATRTKDLEDEAKGWFPDGATVKLTQVTGATTHAEPLVAKFDVTLPGLVSEAGSRTVLPISVFEANGKNPFAPTERKHSVYYPYPFREEDDVKVTLPESMSLADTPAPAALKGGALNYANEVRKNGNAVTFTRSMSVDTMLIETQQYRPLRNFYSAMVAADQKPLVLVTK